MEPEEFTVDCMGIFYCLLTFGLPRKALTAHTHVYKSTQAFWGH